MLQKKAKSASESSTFWSFVFVRLFLFEKNSYADLLPSLKLIYVFFGSDGVVRSGVNPKLVSCRSAAFEPADMFDDSFSSLLSISSVLMTILLLEGRDFKKLSKKRKDDDR